MSERLEALKAAHPNGCWICGRMVKGAACYDEACRPNDALAALVAALEDAGKEQAELLEEANRLVKDTERLADKNCALESERNSLRAQLAASQAALAAAEGALKKTKAQPVFGFDVMLCPRCKRQVNA